MSYLVLSSSLHPESRSRTLARRAHERLAGLVSGESAPRWLDAADLGLPMCDGAGAWDHDGTRTLVDAITAADGVLLASGVYNYAASASAKTLVELGSRAWTEKVVGFLWAAGGIGSYMAPMGLANSLMLDFRAVVVPRFVYATTEAFEEGRLADEAVETRIDEVVSDLVRMTAALRGAPAPAPVD